uniref:Methanethiol oxidase n=1 Tax=Rhabditophanes sp. KR3021 TaxID=114890 RepID=A0AC35U8N2_9BILA
MSFCCGKGDIGYKTPQDAINGPKEKVIFMTCVNVNKGGHDMIVTVDVDRKSTSYGEIIGRCVLPYENDEIHHTGWNTCSSCFGQNNLSRSHLIVPCLGTSRIYAINVADPRNLIVDKIVEPETLSKFNVTFPHTSHCLADGNIMISTLGDNDYNNRGNFILLDGKTFVPKETWIDSTSTEPAFNYDFWYQPRINTMISTEWGNPNNIKSGFSLADVGEGKYGNNITVFNWKEKTVRQTLKLEGPEGYLPLEVRFLHEPSSYHAFIGTGLGSAMYHIHAPKEDGVFQADMVHAFKPKKVQNWILPEMPALVTDIIISMSDKYLYASCWLHGSIKQFDISDPNNIRLIGSVFIGGLLHKKTGIKVVDDSEMTEQPEQLVVKGKAVEGGPQMLQLSLDGKRLYVTTSLYSHWDKQFFPKMYEQGSSMLTVDVGDDGKMSVNNDFHLTFNDLENGPFLAHEMRYENGDCTSDIWI